MDPRVAIVETPGRGVVRYYDATAEFFEPNTKDLVIISTWSGEDLALFTEDDWKSVTVVNDKGVLMFSYEKPPISPVRMQ